MTKTYNPMDYRARKRTQAVRYLNVRQSVLFYLYLIFVLCVVTFVWMWALIPVRQILPSTN
jgi:cell division septal protein FtsQ